MAVKATSKQALHWLRSKGLDVKSRSNIYRMACALQEFTRQDLVCFSHATRCPMEINQVTGRIKELLDTGAVYVKRTIRNPDTGRPVELLRANKAVAHRFHSITRG